MAQGNNSFYNRLYYIFDNINGLSPDIEISNKNIFPLFPVSLVCTGTSMTVTLETEEPFSGRLFSQEGGRDCEARGNARTETRLTIPFEAGREYLLVSNLICFRRKGVVGCVVCLVRREVCTALWWWSSTTQSYRGRGTGPCSYTASSRRGTRLSPTAMMCSQSK